MVRGSAISKRISSGANIALAWYIGKILLALAFITALFSLFLYSKVTGNFDLTETSPTRRLLANGIYFYFVVPALFSPLYLYGVLKLTTDMPEWKWRYRRITAKVLRVSALVLLLALTIQVLLAFEILPAGAADAVVPLVWLALAVTYILLLLYTSAIYWSAHDSLYLSIAILLITLQIIGLYMGFSTHFSVIPFGLDLEFAWPDMQGQPEAAFAVTFVYNLLYIAVALLYLSGLRRSVDRIIDEAKNSVKGVGEPQ
jgi:hypothetical protein